MKNKFPFGVALVFGLLLVLSPTIFLVIIKTFNPNVEGMVLLPIYIVCIPFFAINFLGFALGSKKIALSILIATIFIYLYLFI